MGNSNFNLSLDLLTDIYLYISSNINEHIYLKGNVLLNHILSETARGTTDVDMSLLNQNLYYNILPKLNSLCEDLVKDNIIDNFDIRQEISDKKSGGVKFYKNGINIGGIDISLHQSNNNFGISNYILNTGDNIQGSSIERIICDKMLSTLSRKRFRRPKDFYDIYIIVKSAIECDYSTVIDIMVDKVGLDEVVDLFNNYPFSEDILENIIVAWNRLKVESMIGSLEVSKPDFGDMMGRYSILYQFLNNELRRRLDAQSI